MEPTGLAVDGFGNVYIADTGHDQIWFWPRGDRRLCVVNTEMAGGLSRPTSLVVDAAGILYIADTGHNRVLRMVASCNPGNIAEIDTNPFSLNGPSGLTVCGGNLFIADTGNDRVLRYPVLLGRGSVLFAGGGTMLGCNYTGSALEARLSKPTGLAVDGPCCVYIADTGNHCIRRVCLSNGVIEPVFGP
jgi:DNA-binding beta-propeller fold protein YncE